MSNTDIFDHDLNPILETASNEELGVIHDILMKKQITEALSIEEVYKQHYPDHGKYADLIAKEVRDFGGNTFVNVFRGEGPDYREIVCDVAKQLKAPFERHQEIETIEAAILGTILVKALEKMTEEEKQEVLGIVRKSNKNWTGGVSVLVLQNVFRAGGFASYQLMLIVVNAVVKGILGRGLSLAVNTALTRTMAIAVGPIGWAVSGLIAAIQFAGPSYKVTIPCVAYIAMLRQMQNVMKCEQCGTLQNENFKHCSQCGARLSGGDEEEREPA